jgi:hypothetical protein
MRFYNQQHKYCCGIELHARKMYVCIIDQKGKTKVHQNIQTDPELFFKLAFPYIDEIVVGVECVFCPEKSSGTSIGNGSLTSVTSTKYRSPSDTHYSGSRIPTSNFVRVEQLFFDHSSDN